MPVVEAEDQSNIASDGSTSPIISIFSEQDLTDLASDRSWSGNGSEGSPYIIENLTIDALNSSNCITIRNTVSHILIRNCTFLNTSTGSETGIGAGAAVYLKNMRNIVIDDIQIDPCYKGVVIEGSAKVKLNNSFISTYNNSIMIRDSSTELVVENNRIYTLQYGAILQGTSNLSFDNNLVHGRIGGIVSNNSINTRIMENNILYSENWSIYLSDMIFPVVNGNNIVSNRNGVACVGDQYGVFKYNTIYGNNYPYIGTGFLIVSSVNTVIDANTITYFHSNIKIRSSNTISLRQMLFSRSDISISSFRSTNLELSDITISETWKGIEIIESENVNLTGITMTANIDDGIDAHEVKGLVIRHATLQSQGYSIRFDTVREFLVDSCNIQSIGLSMKIDNSTNGTLLNNEAISTNSGGVVLKWSTDVLIKNNDLNTYYSAGPSNGFSLHFRDGCGNITLDGNSIKGYGLKLFDDLDDMDHIRSFLETLVVTGDNYIGSKRLKFLKDIDLENKSIRSVNGMVILYRASNVIIDLVENDRYHSTYVCVDSSNVEVFRTKISNSAPGGVFLNSSNISISHGDFGFSDLGLLIKGCENVHLMSNEFSSCKESLIIENSTDVEIFGSTFERGYLRTNGISVHGSTNLNISTSMFNLTTFPLNITGCSDIELYGNSIGNNTYPVIVKDSVRGRVNKNTFHFQAVGLEMKKSRNINISSNRFNTSTRGLKCSSCVNMEIAENLIEGALVGIELNRTDASKISYNLIKKNDIGLFQNDTFRNIITENLFLDNEKEAVVLDECGSGKIFNNSFVWNNGITTIPFDHRKQVSISSSNFVPWYVKGYGNYWSEYLSPDSDDDGIVDSPFEIVDGGDQDLYPLRFSPYPLASAPLNVECIPGYQSIEMTWEGPEKNLGSSIWGYHIFRGTEPEKLTIMETPGMLPNHYSDTSATPGTRYYYGIRAINEYGEGELSDIVNGYLDDTPPVVEILFPEWGQWINITRLEVRWRGTDNESGLTGYMIKMDNEDWIDAGNLTRYPFFRLLEGRHIFKVQVNNSVGTRTTESLEFFVDTVPPDLRFTCPEVIYSRQPDAFIEWKGSDQGSGIWRYRSKVDDGPWSELFTAEYMYVQLVDPVTEITIEARDIAGNSRSRSIMVHYDPDPPILNSQYPGEKIYLNGSQVRIHWSFYDLGSGIEQFRIRTDGLDKYLDWKIQEYLLLNLQEGHHRVNISAIDHAGNMNSTTIEFVIDRTPPEILSYGPVGENVLTDTMIWAVLSEEVQIGTLLFKVLYVKGSLSVTREELFFKPNSALDYGMTYTVELSANDLAGNRLPVSNWTFSTPALGYIVGRVVDKDGRGLKDARVQVSTGSNTMTNEKGYFYLSLPGGTYEVHITKDNYRERTMKVDVTSGMTSDLSDIEIRAEGDLGSLPVIIAIAIIVILVLVAVLIIVIRKKRPRVTDEFYIIDEPPPENTDDPEEVEFEIEFFDGRTNYYQLLDLEDNATGPEIKRAYRKLASLYHPDRMAARGEEMELDEVADLMRDINEAKSVLLDPLRRQVYDMSLLEQEM